MSKYVISRGQKGETFFTNSSSYDRPKWVGLNEATTYMTVEQAQQALQKMFGYGQYTAAIRALTEFEVEIVDDQNARTDGDETVSDETVELSSDEDDMVASKTGQTPDFELDPSIEDEEQAISPLELKTMGLLGRYYGKKRAEKMYPSPKDPTKKAVKESETMPAKPKNEPKSEQPKEQPIPHYELPKSKDVDFGELGSENDPTDSFTDEGDVDTKVNIPSNVKSALNKAIADAKKEADCWGEYDYDDNVASFELTLLNALEQLKQDLDDGTVGALKCAQLKLASFMNPITTKVPEVVRDFILKGGKKRKLSDIYSGLREGTYDQAISEIEQIVYNVRIMGQMDPRAAAAADENDVSEIKVGGTPLSYATYDVDPESGIVRIRGKLVSRRRGLTSQEVRNAGISVAGTPIKVNSAVVEAPQAEM